MDEATREFMDLVDCEEWEVKDADPDRLKLDATEEADKSVARKLSGYVDGGLGKVEMPFGKHKGLPIEAVPGDYLRWLAWQPDKGYKSTKKFKVQLRHYMTQKGI
jgi:hypothetical protein